MVQIVKGKMLNTVAVIKANAVPVKDEYSARVLYCEQYYKLYAHRIAACRKISASAASFSYIEKVIIKVITTDNKIRTRKDNKSLFCSRQKSCELKYLYTLNNSSIARKQTARIMTAINIPSLIQMLR